MPERDGTGPKGKGEMTGKGKGACIVRIDEKPQPVEEGKEKDHAQTS